MDEYAIIFKLDNGDRISGIYTAPSYITAAEWAKQKIELRELFIMESVAQGCALIIDAEAVVWTAVEPFDREEYENAVEANRNPGNREGTEEV